MIVVGRSPPVIVVNGVQYKLMCHCSSLHSTNGESPGIVEDASKQRRLIRSPNLMGVLRAVKREEAPDFSRVSSSSIAIWRRRADSNRRIKVLQTLALSHLATSPQISIYSENKGFADLCQTGRFVRSNKQTSCRTKIYGAEGGTRTRTSLRTLRPQRSLSTNFSTPARVIAAANRIPIFICKFGRSGGIRTPDRWFWRPVL